MLCRSNTNLRETQKQNGASRLSNTYHSMCRNGMRFVWSCFNHVLVQSGPHTCRAAPDLPKWAPWWPPRARTSRSNCIAPAPRKELPRPREAQACGAKLGGAGPPSHAHSFSLETDRQCTIACKITSPRAATPDKAPWSARVCTAMCSSQTTSAHLSRAMHGRMRTLHSRRSTTPSTTAQPNHCPDASTRFC